MGLENRKSLVSENSAKKTMKTITNMDLNGECFYNTIRSSFSIPAPLNIPFFTNCFVLYLTVVFVSFILFFQALLCTATTLFTNE